MATLPTTGSVAPSLAPGSEAQYLVAQARMVDAERIRYQIRTSPTASMSHEPTLVVGPDLGKYLSGIKADRPSLAGSSAVYFPVLVRNDGTSLKVQVAGPTLNQEWGAEFKHAKGTGYGPLADAIAAQTGGAVAPPAEAEADEAEDEDTDPDTDPEPTLPNGEKV